MVGEAEQELAIKHLEHLAVENNWEMGPKCIPKSQQTRRKIKSTCKQLMLAELAGKMHEMCLTGSSCGLELLSGGSKFSKIPQCFLGIPEHSQLCGKLGAGREGDVCVCKVWQEIITHKSCGESESPIPTCKKKGKKYRVFYKPLDMKTLEIYGI